MKNKNPLCVPTRSHDPAPGPFARPLRLLVPLLAALLLGGCGGDPPEEKEDGDGGHREVSIRYTEPSRETVRVTQHALGTLRAQKTPQVAAEVAGTVTRLHVDEGDRVQAGDRIAEVDDRDYRLQLERSRADLRRLQSRVTLQEITVGRHRDLHRQDHVSRQSLDEVEAELEVLREELAGARLAERVAQRDLERTRIRAPFDGEVETRRVSEGDYVQAGTVLYHLDSADILQVRAAFPESVARDLTTGMPLKVANPSAGGDPVTARVDEILPGISESGRAVRIIARLENPGGWRSGASVDVELVLEERQGLVVPRQALVQRPEGDTVYVLDGDRERVQARRVKVGQRMSDGVEILEGLSAGEAVAVDGAGFLSDGAKVKASARNGDPS